MITLDGLQELDDAAFNRAVAEAAGWKFVLHSARNMPDYSNDLNAAWELCGMLHTVSLHRFSTDDETLAEVRPAYGGEEYTGLHKQPARALSAAWMALKLAGA